MPGCCADAPSARERGAVHDEHDVDAGRGWLAAAAADPRACKWEWDHGEGIALLEAGRFWDLLSVPERLGLLTLDLLWRPALPVPGPTWWTSR